MVDLAKISGVQKQEEEKKPEPVKFVQNLPSFDSLLRNETFMKGFCSVLDRRTFKTDNIATMMVICQMEILEELRKLNDNMEAYLSASNTRAAKVLSK